MEPQSVTHTPQSSLFSVSLFFQPFLPFSQFPLLSGLRSLSFPPLNNLLFLFPSYSLLANSFFTGPCAEGRYSLFKLITTHAYIHIHSAVSDSWPKHLFILLHSLSSALAPLMSALANCSP